MRDASVSWQKRHQEHFGSGVAQVEHEQQAHDQRRFGRAQSEERIPIIRAILVPLIRVVPSVLSFRVDIVSPMDIQPSILSV